MRKVPVITLASLIAVLGLVVAPAQSATLLGTDTPDVRLAPGESAEGVFDLDDFFDSSASATIEYTQDGAAVADGVVTIYGAAEAGASTVQFSASAGGESLDAESTVVVSNGIIANVPDIDNNNRVAGVAGGNAFLNGIAPGSSVASSEALALVGGGDFSSLTGASATASAALLATIGEVSVSQAETGLYVRSSEVMASGAGSASYGGLTATVMADGSYELAAGDDFMGPVVVTLGSSADAVHVVAAKASGVDGGFTTLAPTGFAAATVAETGDGVTITAAEGQGALLIANAGIAVGDYATVSMDFEASAAASIAVIGFDAADIGGVVGAGFSYNLVTGDAVEVGAMKNLAVTTMPKSGSVVPGLQVVNSGAGTLVVEISNVGVINAGPLANYAINPNANLVANDLSSDAGLIVDVASIGAVGGTIVADNNFASANGAGSLQLASTADTPANDTILFAADAGTLQAECVVKKVSGDSGLFFLHLTNTNGVIGETQVPVGSIGSTWEKVVANGVFNANPTTLVVVQQTGDATVVVDDIVVRALDDSAKVFDAGLMQ